MPLSVGLGVRMPCVGVTADCPHLAVVSDAVGTSHFGRCSFACREVQGW